MTNILTELSPIECKGLREKAMKYQCSAFWNHLCVRPDYKVKPCCRFELESKERLPLLNADNPQEALQSGFFKSLREKALVNSENSACKKCYGEEDVGLSSMRNNINIHFPSKNMLAGDVNPEEIQFVEVFLGDICNLKCMTCEPALSTTWRSDYERLGWQMKERSEVPDYLTLFDNLSHLKEVKFVGGEPLLARSHPPILKKISERSGFTVKLSYFTNVTTWPSHDVLELWKKFNKVTIWWSIDGFKKVNDYIRFPSKWKNVEENCRKFLKLSSDFPNLEIKMNCTVSTYNLLSLSELERWFLRLQCEFPKASLARVRFNPLVEPNFLRITNSPDFIKEVFISQCEDKNLSDRLLPVLKVLKKSPSLNVNCEKEFLSYTRILDKLRGISVTDYISDLRPYFNNTN